MVDPKNILRGNKPKNLLRGAKLTPVSDTDLKQVMGTAVSDLHAPKPKKLTPVSDTDLKHIKKSKPKY